MKESSRRTSELRYNERRAKKTNAYGTDLRSPENQFTPMYEGDDFRRVTGTRGYYTFHTRYDHDDLNLTQRITATVQEQLNDPSFHMEWKVYEKWNKRAQEVYRLRIESDLPRRICENEEAA